MITTTGRIYSSNFIKTRISRKFARSDELFSYSKKTSNDGTKKKHGENQ